MLEQTEQQIIERFSKIIPRLSETNKSYLLGIGEGMIIMTENREEKKELHLQKEKQKTE